MAKKKTIFIPHEQVAQTLSEGNCSGELVPSADGKGWHFTPNERSRPLAEQDKEGHKVQLAFYKDKDKAEDPDVAVAKADPEFVAAAKSLGLSPEDPVRLTKLFR